MSGRGIEPTRPRRSVFSAGSGGSATILDIEIVQTVQNLAHDVKLIAGKRAVVRAYVEPQALPRDVRVRGEIAVSRGAGSPERYMISRNIVSLRTTGHPTVDAQRKDADLSLNFEIATPDFGPMRVRFNRLIPVAAGDDIPISGGAATRTANFVAAPPLRIRVVGLRYTDDRRTPPQDFAPDALHFDFLRSYLTRTYPVPAVEWSQIVVSAGPLVKPPFSDGTDADPLWQRLAVLVLQRLQQLRQADVNAGRDPRTHYYGLVADDSGFFRGRATKVADIADPSIVAFGPGGRNGFAWDTDGSYADWYGAHELGHTLGCRHPGFCRNQPRDPLSQFPYAQGLISDSTEGCIGFDTGDPALNIPMRALPYEQASDFMTYCENQWISRHTYEELLARLTLEDTQFAPPTS